MGTAQLLTGVFPKVAAFPCTYRKFQLSLELVRPERGSSARLVGASGFFFIAQILAGLAHTHAGRKLLLAEEKMKQSSLDSQITRLGLHTQPGSE